jgi:hypothetical protein
MKRQPENPRARAAEDLLRQTRLLKSQLSIFGKSAQEVHRRLNGEIPDDEVESMRSPAANLLGTLECLIADDLKPVLAKLGELDSLLQKEVVARR